MSVAGSDGLYQATWDSHVNRAALGSWADLHISRFSDKYLGCNDLRFFLLCEKMRIVMRREEYFGKILDENCFWNT